MKKNSVLCAVAGVLLVGGVILIVPMFRAGPAPEPVADVDVEATVEKSPEELAREEQRRQWREDVNAAANKEDMSLRGMFVFMMSDQYTALPADEKKAYDDGVVAAFSDPTDPETDMVVGSAFMYEQMPEEYRDHPMVDVMLRAAEERFAKFFALDKEAQDQILDRFIAFEEGIREWAENNPDSPRVKEMQANMARSVTGATSDEVEIGMALQQQLTPTLRAYRQALYEAYDRRRKELSMRKSMWSRMR